MNEKPKVAFVCTHNSCRSQMAEAISRIFAAEVYDVFSAGTAIKNQINPDAVRIINNLYALDMTENQHPKLLEELPAVDIVITMGCGVACPFLPCKYREDWGLADPTGKSEADYRNTAKVIESKVKDLTRRIQNSDIPVFG
jgi:arsenate reductase (thioredoxin)